MTFMYLKIYIRKLSSKWVHVGPASLAMELFKFE